MTPLDARLNVAFLRRVLQSQYQWLRTDSSAAGSTRAALTCEYLKSIPLAVPPPAEQEEIISFIQRSESQSVSLLLKIADAITRLRELRTALISAAVTGKIDVREHVA